MIALMNVLAIVHLLQIILLIIRPESVLIIVLLAHSLTQVPEPAFNIVQVLR
jgi:hypothetical protein